MSKPPAPKNHARDLEAVLYNGARTLTRLRKRASAPETIADLEALTRELDAARNMLASGAVAIYEVRSTSAGPVPPGYVGIGDRMFRGELLSNAWLLKLLEGLQAARKYDDEAAAVGRSPATTAKALGLFLEAVKDLPREKPVEGFQPAGKKGRRLISRFGNMGMGRM
jgi:hypothetical protein